MFNDDNGGKICLMCHRWENMFNDDNGGKICLMMTMVGKYVK